ncbi:MAG: hydantoinase/oxoprolinase family protein [Candidatus Latescibacteria bacterium]|nr:hydantoinase/oxoprolinase family protein [Candidatus Latescibacterota bacterium]
MGKLIGADIGGTFTDIVLLDSDRGSLHIGKVATTPRNLSLGLMAGLDALGASPDGVELVIHGTTAATNAILERKGGRCGLIATQGFRDILELRRRDRPHLYGLTGTYEPLIPRDLRDEVPERISAEGEILTPLDEAEVLRAAGRLVGEGVEAIVISFLNAYINPAHERQARALVESQWPDLFVVASSDILPLFREFERTSTAVVNAYVQPIVSRYLGRLQERLRAWGYRKDVLIVQSNGGVMSAEAGRALAVNTVLSGPAAGVIAAAHIASESGFRNLIAYDMGGTSLDVSLVADGKPTLSNGAELAFGIPIMVSMIDIHTIGAGGGSIARVDPGGILQVGPDSAGAEPGPVCYGRGGTEPTVTDASLVLGRINPDYPIAGGAGFSFDLDRARSAMADRVGKPLGLTPEGAALAVIAVANNRIAGGIRRVSIDRGHDPRDFVLFSFGGGGPLFVSFLLRELGMRCGLVPFHPGIVSAWGCAIADLRRDFVTMVNRRLSEVEASAVEGILAGHLTEGEAFLRREGLSYTEVRVVREAELSYEGQTHLIRTPLPAGPLTIPEIAERFRGAYLRRYGREGEGFGELEALLARIPMRLVNLRTAVIGVRPERALRDFVRRPETRLEEAFKGMRPVYLEDRFVECPTYERARLPWDARLSGPAVIEQPDTTVWLEPGTHARVDEGGSLLIEIS